EAITQAIIAMAHSLSLRCIAEGVETAAQAEYLKSHGCEEAQGYLYTQPLPEREFRAWWRERHASGDEHVAEVGELDPLPRVLLDHDDRPAVTPLQVAEDVEHHVDVARLETDRRLVDQQHRR